MPTGPKRTGAAAALLKILYWVYQVVLVVSFAILVFSALSSESGRRQAELVRQGPAALGVSSARE